MVFLSPSKYQFNTSNSTVTISFHILSDSLFTEHPIIQCCIISATDSNINPLNPKLNPICYLLALLGAHHFLCVSRIRVKLLTFRLLMSYIYGAPILDVYDISRLRVKYTSCSRGALIRTRGFGEKYFGVQSETGTVFPPITSVFPCQHHSTNVSRSSSCRGQLKCGGTRAETRFRLSAKGTSPFKSAGGVSSVEHWQPSCAHQR